jgi:hypothetical protein
MKELAEKKAIPPYLPYATLDTFFRNVKVALPSRIDRSVLPSMSGTIQGQLLATLSFLGFIREDGTPTDKLAAYAHSEGPEKQRILKEILVSSFPFLFKDGFDLKRATLAQLYERFSKTGISGSTTRKCATFFLKAATDAGIELSPHFGKKRKLSSGGQAKPRRRVEKEVQTKPAPQVEEMQGARQESELSIEKLLLSKFPSFDPGWPDDVKAKWFDGFSRLMDELKK